MTVDRNKLKFMKIEGNLHKSTEMTVDRNTPKFMKIEGNRHKIDEIDRGPKYTKIYREKTIIDEA